jgi:hypothetical protein
MPTKSSKTMTTAHTYSNAINVVRAIQLHFEGGCRSGSRPEAFLLGRRVFYSVEEGHALQIAAVTLTRSELALKPIVIAKVDRGLEIHMLSDLPAFMKDVPNLNMSGVPYERIAWKCDGRVQSCGLPISMLQLIRPEPWPPGFRPV